MSLQALNIGSSGMLSQSDKLAVTANNLANTTTDGFKRSRVAFADLMYRNLLPGGTGEPATGVGQSFGSGVGVAATQMDFAQGPLRQTGRELDMAISGTGFFTVTNGTGETFYTRAGNFSRNADGQLVLGTATSGLTVQPPLIIPADAQNLAVAVDGTVTAQQGGATVTLGQLEANRFINPEGLTPLDNNLYAASAASGDAEGGMFGADGFGGIQQGFLEGSNVESVEEIVDLISSQRAFELSSQVVQSANERLRLLGTLNQ